MRIVLIAIGCVAAFTGVVWADAETARLAGQTYSWSVAATGAPQCHEEWAFGSDGVVTITSGQEITTQSYALSASEDPSMFVLDRTRLASNGLPDCLGSSDPSSGGTRRSYLMFLNGGGFFTCSSTDTMSCYAVATPKR
jgi:hypothetical protein